jgi:hypothetical protein
MKDDEYRNEEWPTYEIIKIDQEAILKLAKAIERILEVL